MQAVATPAKAGARFGSGISGCVTVDPVSGLRCEMGGEHKGLCVAKDEGGSVHEWEDAPPFIVPHALIERAQAAAVKPALRVVKKGTECSCYRVPVPDWLREEVPGELWVADRIYMRYLEVVVFGASLSHWFELGA